MDDFHTINAECIKRTSDALNEGRKMALDLEHKIVDMKNEREKQLVEVNNRIDELEKDMAILNENVLGVNGLRGILIEIKESMVLFSDNLVSHDKRLSSIEKSIDDEVKRKQPWQNLLINLLEKAIWAAVAFVFGFFFLK